MVHHLTNIIDKKYPLCSVIVVNYNGKDLLKKFMPSILKMKYPNFEVILVDNASKDNSVNTVKKEFPNVNIIQNNKNDGTAEGSNIGLSIAKGDYILWLSNDMELEPDFLTNLINLANSSKDIGVCTCKMKRITEKGEKLNEIDSVGADLDIFGFPSSRGINKIDKGQFDQPSEVFFSFGGALLIKKSVLNLVGGYDPLFFTLADDIDLCWRVRLAGYRIMVQPSAVLYHRVSATLSKWKRSERRFISERNTFRTLLKNYSLLSLLKILPRYFGLIIAEVSFFAIRKPEMTISYFRAIFWNMRNLKDTWLRRQKIQSIRTISDNTIMSYMLDQPTKLLILKEFMASYSTGTLRKYLGEQP